jgi:sulfane dehydrogenase subunit SoxC
MVDMAQAQDCPCTAGMFPAGASRRRFLFAAGSAASLPLAAARATEAVPADPTKVQGRELGQDGGYGSRARFETERRVAGPYPNPLTTWSFTPLASQMGNLTASGLHYERHHSGIPDIDPARHSLIVHGMVDTPKKFSMADLKRLPRVSRRHFIECSGNTGGAYQKLPLKTVQISHGLLSTSEWTGVPFAVLAHEVGLQQGAAWVLAEGADGAVMTRSIPLGKMLQDAVLCYGQNGEAIRPEQGYPLRLLLPGWEGNTHIKWLRRLQVSDKPFMTREETSKYTDLMADGVARQFVFTMEAKSVITFPSPEMRLPGPGFYEISGLAWSGRGRVKSVEVSIDGGATWYPAALDGVPEPVCTVRFTFPFRWNGKPTQLASRCMDETGYMQPTHEELVKLRGTNFYYHYNGIYGWSVAADGSVTHAAA